MLKWLGLFLDDPPAAEKRLLRDLLKQSPEFPDWSASVQAVLDRLLAASQIKREMVCRVLDMPMFNAHALPHKTIVLSQLLVEFCRDQRDQIAFVLAHELAHIHLGHSRKRQFASTVMTVAPLANPIVGMGLRILFDQVYSQEQEFEADNLAVKLSARAGYAPAGSIAILERLGMMAQSGNLVSKMLSTHPPLPDRIKELQRAIRVLPVAPSA